MTRVVRQPEKLIDRVALAVAGGLAVAALGTAALFVLRATSPSWRDGLAFPSGSIVFVAGATAYALLEKRTRLREHRRWLRPIAGFLTVFAAAMTVAAVFPDHPWKAALYWGISLGALQAWMTTDRLRSTDDQRHHRG